MPALFEQVDLTKVNAKQILKALRQFYLGLPEHKQNGNNWAFFENLRTGTAYGKDCQQELDAWAMELWGEQHRITFEVKISRSDFQAELKKPLKRRLGLMLSNEFYFVAPKGLIKPHELPIETGLLEYFEDGRIHKIIPAPFRDAPPPTWKFIASICRRVGKLEEEETGAQPGQFKDNGKEKAS